MMYRFRRQCNWKSCNVYMAIGVRNHYCEEHRIMASLKSRVRANIRSKNTIIELQKLENDEYVRLYNKLVKEVLEEQNEKTL